MTFFSEIRPKKCIFRCPKSLDIKNTGSSIWISDTCDFQISPNITVGLLLCWTYKKKKKKKKTLRNQLAYGGHCCYWQHRSEMLVGHFLQNAKGSTMFCQAFQTQFLMQFSKIVWFCWCCFWHFEKNWLFSQNFACEKAKKLAFYGMFAIFWQIFVIFFC